jgi:hypothetical protein
VVLFKSEGLRRVVESKGYRVERGYPHIVEIAVPTGGLDPRTSHAILAFHRSLDIPPRFGRPYKNVCRWCFADAATAEAFKEQFSGKIAGAKAKGMMPKMIAIALIPDLVDCLTSSGLDFAAQFLT